MKHINRTATYDKFPKIKMSEKAEQCVVGYEDMLDELTKKNPQTVVLDCYIGVDTTAIIKAIKQKYPSATIIASDDIFYDGDKLTKMMESHLTADRVRGVMYYGGLSDFVDTEKLVAQQAVLAQLQKDLNEQVFIVGVGASLITRGTVLAYIDISRWEIQLRYRKGLTNFKQENTDEEILKKYKRGFFIEWRIADKHKRTLYQEADYWVDANVADNPKMMTQTTFTACLNQAVTQPIRTVPYFDPGVWGGQWMKEVCGLDKEEANFAWSFDGVPEENSLLFAFGDTTFEMPAMNLTLARPVELLGKKVYARFGAEFPIRFDLLDTIGGQNLSLQVHPTTDQIHTMYGMAYTQEESYYMLDAAPDAKIYLGVKDGVDEAAMLADLKRASTGEISFPAEKYVNVLPTKKHDHILIPPGTIHCSGTDCMVLEISASAYIFTYKLWDWDRVGLDGVPRPIHLEEGQEALNFDYDTTFVKAELINQFETLQESTGYLEEKTGLHELEFIETIRYTFTEQTIHNTKGTVHMLNLVDGESIIIESPTNQFEPFVIHYAETFIIPANVGAYTMRPFAISEGKEVMVIKAYIKEYQS